MNYEKKLHWSVDDPDKGVKTFNWLVANDMCDPAALVFVDCVMHVKDEQWTIELPNPNAETICHLFAGGNPSRLIPIMNKLDDDEYSVTDFKRESQLALNRWWDGLPNPPFPESPLPSSGEWLELFGIEDEQAE